MASAPDFWWKPGLSLKAALLLPLGHIYGAVCGHRMQKKPKSRSKLPVVCIGNFVVGGTGKTPFAIELAYRLQEDGYKPGFLLRGYGGQRKGPLLVDPTQHSATDVGDEALLLAQQAPTIIAANRPAGAALAETLPVNVLLMDDGFQNPSLAKDLSLLLIDCAVGTGNGFCLPAGPLRAPLARQILKTDCLVLIGEGDAADEAVHLAGRRGLPIVHAHLASLPNVELEDRPLFAFAGIGRPSKFFASLEAAGYDVQKTRSFPDHHSYTSEDARTLLAEAEKADYQLVTTSKDMVRLETSKGEIFHWLSARTAVHDVRMHIDDEDRVMGLIRETLRNRGFSGVASS